MLGKAKTLIESLQSSWNASGSNADDFLMSLYAAIEDEYNSGNTKKGLLAKINVETGYDEKQTKAKYIKARVDLIIKKKDLILTSLNRLQVIDRELAVLQRKKSKPNMVLKINNASSEDYLKAKDLALKKASDRAWNQADPVNENSQASNRGSSIAKSLFYSAIFIATFSMIFDGFLFQVLFSISLLLLFFWFVYIYNPHGSSGEHKGSVSPVLLQEDIDDSLKTIFEKNSYLQKKERVSLELNIKNLESEKLGLLSKIANIVW